MSDYNSRGQYSASPQYWNSTRDGALWNHLKTASMISGNPTVNNKMKINIPHLRVKDDYLCKLLGLYNTQNVHPQL